MLNTLGGGMVGGQVVKTAIKTLFGVVMSSEASTIAPKRCLTGIEINFRPIPPIQYLPIVLTLTSQGWQIESTKAI